MLLYFANSELPLPVLGTVLLLASVYTRTRVVTLFWYRGFPGVSFILELADIKVLIFFNVAFLELTSASSDECGDRRLLLSSGL